MHDKVQLPQSGNFRGEVYRGKHIFSETLSSWSKKVPILNIVKHRTYMFSTTTNNTRTKFHIL